MDRIFSRKQEIARYCGHLLKRADKFGRIATQIAHRANHARGGSEEKQARKLASLGCHDQRHLESGWHPRARGSFQHPQMVTGGSHDVGSEVAKDLAVLSSGTYSKASG